MTTAWVDRMP